VFIRTFALLRLSTERFYKYVGPYGTKEPTRKRFTQSIVRTIFS